MGDVPKAKSLLESLRKSDIDEHLIYTAEQDFNFLQDRVKPYSGALRKSGTFSLDNAFVEKAVEKTSLPDKFDLHSAYPNPFNPITTIKFDLPEASSVVITIYNVLGQKVTTLINGNFPAGRHEREWNATRFSSGIYFVRMQASDFVKTTKVTLLK